MKPYTFSVIVPLYNKQNEIGDTLRSILAQRYAPLEIVVVNDGSTDGSTEVVRSFDSPLIRLITQPNAGECAARNRAIAEARGGYLALLDADDTWDPGYLEEIARHSGRELRIWALPKLSWDSRTSGRHWQGSWNDVVSQQRKLLLSGMTYRI